MPALTAPWSHLPRQQIGRIDIPDLRTTYPPGPGRYDTRPLSQINFLVIHHSGQCASTDNRAQLHTPHDLEAIWHYHTRTLQWPGIGYHLIIDHWGNPFCANGAEVITYGVKNKNRNAYHICLLGNFDYYQPHPLQIEMLRKLLAEVSYGLGRTLHILGHSELAGPDDPTNCPGLTYRYWAFLAFPDHAVEQPGIMAYRRELQRWLEVTKLPA